MMIHPVVEPVVCILIFSHHQLLPLASMANLNSFLPEISRGKLFFFFHPCLLDRKWSTARRFEHLHENVTRVSRALLDTNFCIMRWIRLESSRKFLSRFWFWQFHGCAEFANTGSGKETCNGISLCLFDRASINAKSLVRGYFLLPLYIRFCNAAADAGYQIFFLSFKIFQLKCKILAKDFLSLRGIQSC